MDRPMRPGRGDRTPRPDRRPDGNHLAPTEVTKSHLCTGRNTPFSLPRAIPISLSRGNFVGGEGVGAREQALSSLEKR
jgi:hypothetical protein